MNRGITTNRRFKTQSTMEYLMTYGWAILIIAVVLVVLYRFDVFNPCTFVPKAPPGSCQVSRPNGPYSGMLLNLRGVCSGELPQYVTHIAGGGSSVTVNTANALEQSKVTVSLWFMEPSYGSVCDRPQAGVMYSTSLDRGYYIYLPSCGIMSTVGIDIGTGIPHGGATCLIDEPYSLGTWVHVVGTYDSYSNTIGFYLNGVEYSGGPTGCGALSYMEANAYVFNVPSGDNVYLSNIQIYNLALSANEITALYAEGIGGAPVRLQNLVAWWPLNGDLNDYSGNGNNGVPEGTGGTGAGVVYGDSCMSGYTKT